MKQPIRIGISTCPNDTFAFHGLLTGQVDDRDIDFQFELLDVQQLNEKLLAGEFDVAKASFHAALLLSDSVGVLDAGSALGFGVGPLLLAARENTSPADLFEDESGNTRPAKILCPGEHTTANLLYRLFFPRQGKIENVVFSEIMPQLKIGEADFGVCIHEGRFTYGEEGLDCVADLGELWESETNTPLPLGGIVAQQKLGTELHRRINESIRDSILYAIDDRKRTGSKSETLQTMKKYAQEFSDEVLFSHVDLYVNDWTISLSKRDKNGQTGQAALQMLYEKAIQTGVIEKNKGELKILGATA